MFLPTDQALAIDIRSSAEVMLYGMAEDADAHIPYFGGPIDEWNVFQQSFLTHGNTSFINSVFDLIREYGLYRDSPIVLITKSNRKGLRAASLLQVAGYKHVRVEIRVGNSDGSEMQDQCNQLNQGKHSGMISEKAYILENVCVVH
ncbi:MAG: hypothetical protein K1566_00050 [Candidatus Thiodiazotropha sp. (ex. Lucinisca nassula)]|nr:hypothetical protein [Candidatus Thiodiazotropha sp. (ex. Lucinisca nassula)]MBW9263237.1 hypothetical protein [Candidatus Thiodiazotropha sp. (ex. Lucinisca nassula)]MBW9268009.1 hypothetical protein [Candidatus Thiodiazotropha sp. (ex. Lucinisca nassula)]